MKKTFVVLYAVTLSLLLATALPARAGKSSADYGRQLFNDPALAGSTNDKSCNSCHKDGSGLEKAAGKKKLSRVINRCITGPLGGGKLDGRSVEMRSLKLYLESLAK